METGCDFSTILFRELDDLVIARFSLPKTAALFRSVLPPGKARREASHTVCLPRCCDVSNRSVFVLRARVCVRARGCVLMAERARFVATSVQFSALWAAKGKR